MRWSQTFIPTVKEVPGDAEVLSHQLMIRAGLIRKLASGTYTYLPFGHRALRKAIQIVREEMDAAGATEILMPMLQPIELWEKTGRIKDYGPNLMVVVDRHERRNALGPTHEEVVTQLVADHISSYRQLPITLYQIQTKFRDEFRPRFGVLRSREFLMKDAYSFDTSKEGLDVSYQKMFDAYCRIFRRAGLNYVAVEAESGPIGGEASHEFMIPCDAGEDILIHCPKCGYAANVERAELSRPTPSRPSDQPRPIEQVHTPGTTTIEQVAGLLGMPATSFIKTLIYTTDDGKAVVGLVRGDHEINEAKLARAAGVGGLTMAEPAFIETLTGAAVGFAGPQGLADRGATIVADHAVTELVNAITGANRTDYHVVGVNVGRDFEPAAVADIRVARAGDLCVRCGGELATSRGIEVGHVFKLGTKYSSKLGAGYQDEAGNTHEIIMGCYGIGVNRILAAAIETGHDDKGIIWPISIAPYQVLIVPLGADRSEAVRQASEKLYQDLLVSGIEAIIDDRDARPGVKFNDADLVGIPVRVTVGDKGLKDGNVELKLRRESELKLIPLSQAVATIERTVADLFGELS